MKLTAVILADTSHLTNLHYTYRLGISTISSIVETVSDNLWNVLKMECFPKPSKERWLEIAANFEKNANFPNCIGWETYSNN